MELLTTYPGDPKKRLEKIHGVEEKGLPKKPVSGEWWKLGGGGSVWDGMAFTIPMATCFYGRTLGKTVGPWVKNNWRIRRARDQNLYVCSGGGVNSRQTAK